MQAAYAKVGSGVQDFEDPAELTSRIQNFYTRIEAGQLSFKVDFALADSSFLASLLNADIDPAANDEAVSEYRQVSADFLSLLHRRNAIFQHEYSNYMDLIQPSGA